MAELWKSLLASRCVCLWVFLCSSPASAGKVFWWLSGGSQLRLCLRWASLKCCQTKRTHSPCSPFPQSNMLRVWIVITVKSAFGTCLASSAQPWGGFQAVSGSATGWVCVRLALSVAHFEVLVSMPERGREGKRVDGGVSAKKNSHTWRVIYFLLIGFPCLYSPSPPPLRLHSRLLSYFDFDRNSWFDVRNCRSAATRGRSSPLFSVGGTGNCGLARATNKLNVLTMILTR